MPETVTLEQRLEQARHDAEQLREKLSEAEFQQQAAVAEKRYDDAAKHKAAGDAVREPLLIADAHVQALAAGIGELARHRAEEDRARQERERREQASAAYDRFKAEEAQALDDLGRLKAEIKATYAALRQTIGEAITAEQRAGQARQFAWEQGLVAGQLPEGYPRPPRMNDFASRVSGTGLAALVQRTPDLL
ncbi:hypothetical protein GXW83_27480 [Streptacidiphilus sp. PB12-B1b]|uniref:hypothetical protein n=1 Tax=Streptacidiphilus sp. PB12-B1b TaxID=2705012 RepID=UPI0015FD73DE|nr:hypothetical protein [Streptacidiphilus sp. PB12-B1b]QMU78887.1 hypothetical protein GXW83_27480 [Streptacidiphilus sp. PB12-B1b]